MYITTFYSFKGGVGRTLSLVNVAAALSQNGRRVLLVDFDLEAPGLHTFKALMPPEPNVGIVEYINEFRNTLTAPSVEPYVYEVHDKIRGSGRLWVMPAGKADPAYRSSLASIDWQDLYHRLDGYLLLENLKAQWQQVFQPDYVLIDSRTGYTEVEGICTRQLPDAVTILFIPNEENLAGLRPVVEEIRAEAAGARQKKIHIHFVMSNAPDLDDEDEILDQRMAAFRSALGYEQLTATIHHYDSLALLDQVIFTHARPKSKLAREYIALKDAIIAENIKDGEGMIHSLQKYLHDVSMGSDQVDKDIEKHLEIIKSLHPYDVEILHLVAMTYKGHQNLEKALASIDQAIACGAVTPQMLVDRAEIRLSQNELSESIANFKEALALTGLNLPGVLKALRLLRNLDKKLLIDVAKSAAINALTPEDRALCASLFTWSKEELAASLEIATSVVNDPMANEALKRNAQSQRILALICLGCFEEAIDAIVSLYPRREEMPFQDLFNYAMAEWGKTGQPSPSSFARAISRLESDKRKAKADDSDFHQCLAIAFWTVNDIPNAQYHLSMAQKLAKAPKPACFSCWRYHASTRTEFLADCHEIQRLIAGEGVRPLFFIGPTH